MNYNDMSSLRDCRRDSVSFSINISSLREFLKQSGTDAMFIENKNAITPHQSRRDAMFIASESNIANEKSRRDDMFIASEYALESHKSRRDAMFIATESNIANDKSGTDAMFIESEYAINPHKSHRDETSYISYISQQSISPDFGILKNKNFLHRILKSINIPSLRDYRWESASFTINISSLWEYIRKSGTDDMFIASQYHTTIQQSRRDEMYIKTILHINHSTNSLINHLTNSPFYQSTPLTYARIL